LVLCLFFIGGGCWQIGGVDDGHRFVPGRERRQQRLDQLIIDRAQAAHARPNPKLMQHAHVRGTMPVTQMSKAPPLTLLGQ